MITTPRRLGALALIAAIGLSACSSSGASTSPAASVAAPTTATSAAPSTGDASAAPSMAAAPVPPSASITLQGAGATFPAPLYDSWFQAFNGLYSNVQIDYQANGSGRRHQGHHRGHRRLRRFRRSDEGRGDRGPAVRHEDAPLPDRPWRGGDDLQPAGHAQAPARLGQHRRDLPGHDQEVERPGDRGQQRGRDAARPRHPRRPSLGRLGDDQRIHDLPRHRRPDLAFDRRQGQGGQVADGHRRGRQ